MIKFTDELIRCFSLGSSFLSTGGGGSPYIGVLLAQQTLLDGYVPTLISIDDLPSNAHTVCVGLMGAPEIVYEKIPSLDSGIYAFNKMQDHLQCKIDAILPFEIAGLNGLIPLCIGARLGIPIIDADGMGRAFPKIEMTSFNAYGSFSSPTIIANGKNETVTLDNITDMAVIEKYARALTIAMGGCIFFASYFMQASTARSVIIPRSVSNAIELGQKISAAIKSQQSVLRIACDFLSSSIYKRAEELFSGKIIDLQRSSQTGFTIGKAIIEGINNNISSVELFFQNEYYLVTKNGNALIMTPDLICIVDYDIHEPISTESLRFGQRISIIGIRAPSQLTSAAALKLMGPKNFGLDIEYKPF